MSCYLEEEESDNTKHIWYLKQKTRELMNEKHENEQWW